MATIKQKPRAKKDLESIWEYIADDNETRANQLLNDFDEKFRMLAEHPETGRLRSELYPNVRSFPLGKYIIFYVAIAEGIEVVRVLHSARDIANSFDDL